MLVPNIMRKRTSTEAAARHLHCFTYIVSRLILKGSASYRHWSCGPIWSQRSGTSQSDVLGPHRIELKNLIVNAGRHTTNM